MAVAMAAAMVEATGVAMMVAMVTAITGGEDEGAIKREVLKWISFFPVQEIPIRRRPCWAIRKYSVLIKRNWPIREFHARHL